MLTQFRPQLPPKEGFIEIDLDGERVYQKVYTEIDYQLLELYSYLVDLDFRTSLIELGVI